MSGPPSGVPVGLEEALASVARAIAADTLVTLALKHDQLGHGSGGGL